MKLPVFACVLSCLIGATSLFAQAPAKQPSSGPKTPKEDKSKKLFEQFIVPTFRIEVSEPEMQKLRNEPRKYVRSTIKITTPDGDKSFVEVGIHLKGAAGSFRGVDDRPALTLNFDKFKKGQEFYDLDKLHLNNSVQDGSYLNELTCSDFMRANGVPTARVTHARVYLNNRDLGFYVLKEGYDKKFLKRNFGDDTGNLYDGGFCQEIDAALEKDSGEGVNDRSDLKALIEACREPDATKRAALLEAKLDVDHFCRFMAVELLTCHWDGYVLNRNNYRIYFNPSKGGRAYFIPHGMDQMWGDPNFGVINANALIGQTILNTPELRAKYRDILTELIAKLAPADKINERIAFHAKHVSLAGKEIHPDLERDINNHARELMERMKQRASSLQQQNQQSDPRPLKFDAKNLASLEKMAWEPRKETEDAVVDEVSEGRGLHIQVGPSNRCIASWRTKVLLTAGKYRLEARAKTENVQPAEDQSGTAAGVRLSGAGRENKLAGNSDWAILKHSFEITEGLREVELVLELRANAGHVWYDKQQLFLVKE